MIYEYKPIGSYKRVITETEARALHTQSGGEYTFEEATELAARHGILVFANELDMEPIGSLYATK